MTLQIRFQGGSRAGQSLEFGDEVERITIGRDADQCDVVFPPDETLVGRQHCALQLELGRYRLVLNEDNVVWLNGEIASDDDELTEECDLQLGENGPVLVIRTAHNQRLPSTNNFEEESPGTTTVVQDSTAKSRRAAALSLLAIVLIAGVVGLTYLVWKQNQKSADVQRQQLDKQQKQLEDVEIRLAEEMNLSDQQRQALQQAEEKFTALDGAIAQTDRGMAAALKAAAQSVYLVIIRDGYGNESTFATAWVVDQARGILATNAHVATSFDSLRDDETFVVRSSDEEPRDFTIESVRIHPGYDQFERLWNDYDPTIRASLTQTETVRMPGPACDVALMFVDTKEGLAPALQLAEGETLHSLGSGDLVGSIGFPSEGLVLGGVNKESPTPTSHMAYLISMTDFFGVDDTSLENRLLIQHAIPTIGGSSGSPIINRDGQVVAIHSGGNVIGQAASARIKSAAQINLAQRADLIKELLDDTATDAQQARTQKWKEEIQRYYVKRKDAEFDVSLDGRLDDWRWRLRRGGEFAVTTHSVTSDEVPGDGREHSQHVSLNDSGPFLILAIGEKSSRIRLDVYEMKDGKRDRRHIGRVHEDWLKSAALEMTDPGKLEVIVENEGDATPVKLHVYTAERKPYTAEERCQRIIRRYERIFRDRKYVEVSRVTGTLRFAKQNSVVASAEAVLSLKKTGRYFVVAVADALQDLDLSVSRKENGVDKEITVDRGRYSWAYGGFELDKADDVRALLMGEDDGSKFHLYVFQVSQRDN